MDNIPKDIQFGNANQPTQAPSDINFGASPSGGSSPSDVSFNTSSKTPGMFASFMGDVLSPFMRMMATAHEAGAGVDDLFGKATDEQKQVMSDHIWHSPWGDFKSIQNPIDAMGVGTQASSFFMPLGEASKATQAGLKLVPRMANFITNLLKDTAPFAITQGLGIGLQDAGEGKSAGATITDASANYVSTVAGFGLFKGMGTALKSTAGALMKTEIVKVANQAVIDFMGKALSLDGRFAQGTNITSEDSSKMTNALEKKYQDVHKQAMDAFAQTVQTPTNWSDIYRGIQQKVGGVFDTLFKAKDAKYGEVFTSDMFPNKAPVAGQYASETYDAIERGRNALGLNDLGNVRGNQVNMLTQNINSPASRYLSTIEETLGSKDKPNAISMKDFDNLYTSAPTTPDPVQNKIIKDAQTSLYRSARAELAKSTDSRASETLKAWDEAHTQWQNLSGMMGTKFANSVKNVGDAQAFVEKMFSSKPGVYTQKIIDSLDKSTKGQISDIIYNMALQRSRTMSADYSAGGKAVEKLLDNWVPTGLINPEHEGILRSFSQGMQGTYEDMAAYMQKLTADQTATEAGATAEKPATQEVPEWFAQEFKARTGEDATSQHWSDFEKTAQGKVEEAQQAQKALETSQAIEKTLDGKPLFKVNADGSYDFTNLSKVIDKINKDGKYDDLVKLLSQSGDLSKASSEKLMGVIQGAFGASLAHAHPFIALGLMRNAASKIFGKTAEEVTTKDLSKIVSDALTSGELKPGNFQKLMVNVLTGKYDDAGKIISKLFIAGTNKVESKIISPEE